MAYNLIDLGFIKKTEEYKKAKGEASESEEKKCRFSKKWKGSIMVFKRDGIKELTDSSFSVVRIQPRPQGFSLKKWPHPFFQGKALGTRLVRIKG